ncbi:hypothetical protein KEN49_CDS0365 [Pseudomonas phage vB_Pae3705-KEN49]
MSGDIKWTVQQRHVFQWMIFRHDADDAVRR